MTPERFQSLLQTHGADLRRWPAAERSAANALLQQGDPLLRQWLDEAARLDDWLDGHEVADPGPTLTRRIVASAAPAVVQSARRNSRAWWFGGAGLAVVGLAGSLAGALVVSVALQGSAAPGVDWPERATAFSGLPADWSEE